MHEAIAHNEHGYQSAPRALPACMYRSFQHSTFFKKENKEKKREQKKHAVRAWRANGFTHH
jgi:hypothetical protein